MSTPRVSPFSIAAFACLATGALVGLTPAHLSPAYGEDAPDDIAEIISEAAQVCRAQGGNPDTAAILRGDDLNGDGSSDWIADFARLKCEGAANPACNDNGCTLHLYFWDGNAGWELVFEDFVRSYKFSSSGDTRTMHVTTSGIPCNKPAEESCSYNYRLEKDAVVPVQ